MGYWIVDGKEYSEEDYKEIAKQRKAKKEAELLARWEAEQRAQEEAARLMRQVGAPDSGRALAPKNRENLTAEDTKEHKGEAGPRIEPGGQVLDITKPPGREHAAGELRESGFGHLKVSGHD